MTENEIIAEFDCPYCAVDEDMYSLSFVGDEHECANCKRVVNLSPENTQWMRYHDRGMEMIEPQVRNP